jgi:hypothetical protein
MKKRKLRDISPPVSPTPPLIAGDRARCRERAAAIASGGPIARALKPPVAESSPLRGVPRMP